MIIPISHRSLSPSPSYLGDEDGGDVVPAAWGGRYCLRPPPPPPPLFLYVKEGGGKAPGAVGFASSWSGFDPYPHLDDFPFSASEEGADGRECLSAC